MYVVIFVSLQILFAKAQFIHEDFPKECYFTKDHTVNVEYFCIADIFVTFQAPSSCNPSTIDRSSVDVIRYRCENKLNSMKLYKDVFDDFKNVYMLITSNLGIDTIILTQRKSYPNYDSKITIWQATHNELTEIPITILNWLSSIREVDFSFNRINNLNFEHLDTDLSVVDCSNNNIRNIHTGALSTLSNLEILDVSHNNIVWIDEDAFSDNKDLNVLNLVDNPLKTLGSKLILSLRKVRTLKLPFKSIEELDLSKNAFVTFTEDILKGFINLLYLNLSHSKISKIEDNAFQEQSNLLSLDLSYNNLNDIDNVQFSFLRKLERLNLVGNRLSKLNVIHPVNLPKLKSIKILNNRLSQLYLEGFLKRWELDRDLEIDTPIITKIVGTRPRISSATTTTILTPASTNATLPTTTTQCIESENSILDQQPDTHENISSILTYIIIGVILIIITIITVAIILYFCLRKRVEIAGEGMNAIEFAKFSAHTPLNAYEKEPKISPKKVEEKFFGNVMKMPSRSLPKIPSPAPYTAPEENAYEEIRVVDDAYNHLQFN